MHQTRRGSSAAPKTRPVSGLAAVRERYPDIYVILSPPRGSSTALARVFWEHPSIRYYCHEPFEVTYFLDAPLQEAEKKLLNPLELNGVCGAMEPGAEALVVKEMPYQVGARFALLADLATAPVIFLLRDPRLNISSRMEKKREVGDDPIFPLVETGWELLREQIAYCRERGVPHLVLTAEDLRDRPLDVLPELFERLGLEFDDELISWRGCDDDVDIDNLDGDHSHLYRSVLASTGLEPEIAEMPPVRSFPESGGFRAHVAECLEIYHELRRSSERIAPR